MMLTQVLKRPLLSSKAQHQTYLTQWRIKSRLRLIDKANRSNPRSLDDHLVQEAEILVVGLIWS